MSAALSIAAALERLPDLQVVTGVGRQIAPPAVIIGPPRLTWAGYAQGGQPSTGVFSVYLVVAMTERATEALLSRIASVTAAIEEFTPGVVTMANPGVYPSPGGVLPSYQITVQMEL